MSHREEECDCLEYMIGCFFVGAIIFLVIAIMASISFSPQEKKEEAARGVVRSMGVAVQEKEKKPLSPDEGQVVRQLEAFHQGYKKNVSQKYGNGTISIPARWRWVPHEIDFSCGILRNRYWEIQVDNWRSMRIYQLPKGESLVLSWGHDRLDIKRGGQRIEVSDISRNERELLRWLSIAWQKTVKIKI